MRDATNSSETTFLLYQVVFCNLRTGTRIDIDSAISAWFGGLLCSIIPCPIIFPYLLHTPLTIQWCIRLHLIFSHKRLNSFEHFEDRFSTSAQSFSMKISQTHASGTASNSRNKIMGTKNLKGHENCPILCVPQLRNRCQ